jgi:4-hydroxybenzoate polyprenyltransferase
MRAILELLRISLFPTIAADALVGCFVGAGAWPAAPALLATIAGSLCVYHGAMALNDWADREADRRARPARPIPSGRVSPRQALSLAALLLIVGPLLAAIVDWQASMVLGGVALLAVLYDLCGRGVWLGPLLLGACRAGNLCFGLWMGAAGGPPAEWVWVAVAAYGLYVLSISKLGRLEDVEAARVGRSPSGWLLAAALCCLITPLATRSWSGALLAGLGALVLVRAALPVRDWPRVELVPAMGRALRMLLLLTASFALSSPAEERWLVAGLVLCGYPIASALRQRFPPS